MLRAFAALSVCLFHFVFTTTGYIQSQWFLNICEYGQYGVQLFFVISGFIIPWSMYCNNYKFHNFFAFLLKRLARLELPYLASILLCIVVLLLRVVLLHEPDAAGGISFTRLALHFGYLVPFYNDALWFNQVYWTLAIEFQYYIFIALLFIPLVRGGLFLRICIYMLFMAASFLFSSNFLPYWLPVFLLGILLFLYKAKIITALEYYIVTAFTLCFCIYQYGFPGILFSALPLPFILYWSGLELKPAVFLGKISYSIYLIHAVIGSAIINLLSHHFTGFFGKVMVISAGMAVTIASAWLMYLLIENPSKKLSARISYLGFKDPK